MAGSVSFRLWREGKGETSLWIWLDLYPFVSRRDPCLPTASFGWICNISASGLTTPTMKEEGSTFAVAASREGVYSSFNMNTEDGWKSMQG